MNRTVRYMFVARCKFFLRKHTLLLMRLLTTMNLPTERPVALWSRSATTLTARKILWSSDKAIRLPPCRFSRFPTFLGHTAMTRGCSG